MIGKRISDDDFVDKKNFFLFLSLQQDSQLILLCNLC